jgi:predicted secreted Zn-dependent protease
VALKGKFVLTLVKWKEYGSMTAPQKKAWDDMIALLTAHEREHVAISYRGAEKLIKTLKGLDVTLAPQKVADANTAIQADQDDFDSAAKTNHGANDWGTFKKVVLDTSADPPPTPSQTPPPTKP